MASKFVQPDEVLSAIVGPGVIARNELTQKVMDYVTRNNLMDSNVKTQINADEKLILLFGGRQSISMFELTKFLIIHIKPVE